MSGAAARAVVSGGPCSTCDAALTGPFCHQCGEPRSHHGDLALRHLLHDAVHEFAHVDGKAFLLFVIIAGATALAIVLGVTWASGHWS